MSKSSPNLGTFCWNELGTRDVAASKAFYSQLFGWGTEDVPMPEPMGGVYTLLKLGETQIGGLYELAGPQFEHVPPHWAVYVAVDDVDAKVEQVLRDGGQVIWGPYDVPDTGRMAGFADPTGAHLCLFQSKGAEERPDLASRAGSFCWAELNTNDPEAARAFYTSLFGWDAKSDAGDPVAYVEWIHAGRPIGGMMQIQPEWGEVPPNWTTYVAVEDCDATVAQAQELGARILVEPTTIPAVGRFAVFQDPGGAGLAVIWLDPAHLEKG